MSELETYLNSNGVSVSKDGDKWMALKGENIQESTAVFSSYKEIAMVEMYSIIQSKQRSSLLNKIRSDISEGTLDPKDVKEYFEF